MKTYIGTTVAALFIGCILISSATAVPTINCDPLQNILNNPENTKLIEGKLSIKKSRNFFLTHLTDIHDDLTGNVRTKGFIIDFIIKIIEWLISIVQELIDLVYKLIDLVEIMNTLVDIINTLFELILELINKILDIFTPGAVY